MHWLLLVDRIFVHMYVIIKDCKGKDMKFRRIRIDPQPGQFYPHPQGTVGIGVHALEVERKSMRHHLLTGLTIQKGTQKITLLL